MNECRMHYSAAFPTTKPQPLCQIEDALDKTKHGAFILYSAKVLSKCLSKNPRRRAGLERNLINNSDQICKTEAQIAGRL